jgi:hypothetical protein
LPEAAHRLAGELVGWLESRGGNSSREEVVSAFKDKCPAEDMPLFKQLLRQVMGIRICWAKDGLGGGFHVESAFAGANRGGEGRGPPLHLQTKYLTKPTLPTYFRWLSFTRRELMLASGC